MPQFDTSSIIYAWDNYPVQQFPGLWDWISDLINDGTITMSSVALREVDDKTPDCGQWLRDADIQTHEISNAILQESLQINRLLGIVNDRYGGGVGENDILIIATAVVFCKELVTDESRQPRPPQNPLNFKIPAVCSRVSVSCVNFLEFIKRSGAVFR